MHERSTELKQRALSEANEIFFLVRQSEERIKALAHSLGDALLGLGPHRNDHELAYRRAREYTGKGDLCPRCAVRTAAQTKLSVEASTNELDFVICPTCAFRTVVAK